MAVDILPDALWRKGRLMLIDTTLDGIRENASSGEELERLNLLMRLLNHEANGECLEVEKDQLMRRLLRTIEQILTLLKNCYGKNTWSLGEITSQRAPLSEDEIQAASTYLFGLDVLAELSEYIKGGHVYAERKH